MTTHHQIVRDLSDRIVAAQVPIRILDGIKWDESIKAAFFKQGAKALPPVDLAYYQRYPLPYNPEDKIAEFRSIIRDTKNHLGQYSPISHIMVHRCEDYMKAIEMLTARGTPRFAQLSMELYGAPDDAFNPGGPRLSELGSLLEGTLKTLSKEIASDADVKRFSAEETMTILQDKLSGYFTEHPKNFVKLSDNIIADAAAGAESIKINANSTFSERDLKYLEVHEGWVHLGTTLNGSSQPYCTFLGKGTPPSSITQEGLAVIAEIFTFSSYPARMLKIINRVKSLDLVRQGANFLDIYRFYREQDYDEEDSYNNSVRVFRGSLPDGKPFTKDLSYSKGFLLIYNYIRLAVKKGLVKHINTFFVGKTLIDEIQFLTNLIEEGLVAPPMYIPPQFRDIAALSAWMSFSIYLNKFDLETIEAQYDHILHE